MPGDTVKIRLRTGRYNVDKAYIYVNNVEYPMTRIKADGLFDYYEADIKVGEEKLYYYLEMKWKERILLKVQFIYKTV